MFCLPGSWRQRANRYDQMGQTCLLGQSELFNLRVGKTRRVMGVIRDAVVPYGEGVAEAARGWLVRLSWMVQQQTHYAPPLLLPCAT